MRMIDNIEDQYGNQGVLAILSVGSILALGIGFIVGNSLFSSDLLETFLVSPAWSICAIALASSAIFMCAKLMKNTAISLAMSPILGLLFFSWFIWLPWSMVNCNPESTPSCAQYNFSSWAVLMLYLLLFEVCMMFAASLGSSAALHDNDIKMVYRETLDHFKDFFAGIFTEEHKLHPWETSQGLGLHRNRWLTLYIVGMGILAGPGLVALVWLLLIHFQVDDPCQLFCNSLLLKNEESILVFFELTAFYWVPILVIFLFSALIMSTHLLSPYGTKVGRDVTLASIFLGENLFEDTVAMCQGILDYTTRNKCAHAASELAGDALTLAGNDAEAYEYYYTGVTADSTCLRLLIEYADCLTTLGRNDEASRNYSEVIDRTSPHGKKKLDSQKAYYRAKAYHGLDLNSDALHILQTSAFSKGEKPKALKLKAEVLCALHQGSEALTTIEEAIKYIPEDEEVLIIKGIALESVGMHDEALIWYSQAVPRANSPRVRALLNIGKAQILAKMDRLEEAVVCYTTALAVYHQQKQLWTEKGRLLQLMGRDVEAATCFDTANKIQ